MVPDGNWGIPLNHSDIFGDWNGLVQEAKTGRADLAPAPFSRTIERNQVISYGLPVYPDMYVVK